MAIHSIGSNSKDFSTITLWEADVGRTTGDIGECWADGAVFAGVDDTVAINAAAITLSVEATQRHTGLEGTGARIVGDSSDVYIQINTFASTVEWLEFDANGNAANGSSDNGICYANIAGAKFQNMIVHGCTDSRPQYGILCNGNTDVYNNFVYDIINTSTDADVCYCIGESGGSATIFKWNNNTVVRAVNNNGTGTSGGMIMGNSGNTSEMQNNISLDNGTGSGTGPIYDFFFDTDATGDNNLSSDATADDDENTANSSVINQTPTDIVTGIGAGVWDLRLKDGINAAVGAGKDLGTDEAVDILGRNRDTENDTWDIGAHQFVTGFAITGDNTLTLTPTATLAHSDNESIAGTVTLTLTPTATLDQSNNDSIAGTTTLSFAIAAVMSGPSVAQAGYMVHADVVASALEHTNNRHMFKGPNNRIWGLFEHVSDQWFLYEHDNTTPAAFGDTGGWIRAQENGAGDLGHFGDNAGFRPTVYYDEVNEKLHIYQMHPSTSELYYTVDYNSGTNDWTRNIDGINVGVSGERNGHVVDSLGFAWIAHWTGTEEIKVRYLDTDDVFKDGFTIQTPGDGTAGNQRISNGIQWNNAGTASIAFGIVNDTTVDAIEFHSRADSALKTASWTQEIVDDANGTYLAADGHISLAVGDFFGDSSSTIFLAAKPSSGAPNNKYQVYRRPPTGTPWSARNEDLGASLTRVKLQVHNDRRELYAGYSNTTSIDARISPGDGSLTFGSAIELIKDDGVTTFGDDIGVLEAKPLSDSDDMMFTGITGAGTWWAKVDLTNTGGNISGTSTINFSIAASMAQSDNFSIAATSTLVLTPAAAMAHTDFFNISGVTTLNFSIDALMDGPGGAISGTSVLTLTPAATFAQSDFYSLNASNTLVLTPNGIMTLNEFYSLSGTTQLSLVPDASLIGPSGVAITGDNTLTFTPSANLVGPTQSGWLVLGASSLDDVVAAVWAAQVADHDSVSGSFGERVGKKLLSLAQFLGLK